MGGAKVGHTKTVSYYRVPGGCCVAWRQGVREMCLSRIDTNMVTIRSLHDKRDFSSV